MVYVEREVGLGSGPVSSERPLKARGKNAEARR